MIAQRLVGVQEAYDSRLTRRHYPVVTYGESTELLIDFGDPMSAASRKPGLASGGINLADAQTLMSASGLTLTTEPYGCRGPVGA